MSLHIKLLLKGVVEALFDDIQHRFFQRHLFDSYDEYSDKLKGRKVVTMDENRSVISEGNRPSSSGGGSSVVDNRSQGDSTRYVRSDAPSPSSRATGSSTQNNILNPAPLTIISSTPPPEGWNLPCGRF